MLHCSHTCGIEVGGHFVVTGGQDESAPEGALATVAKYSQFGLVDYLPSLNQRRANHACSSFISDGGDTVGIMFVIKYQHFIIMIQVLLVTGGRNWQGGTRTFLDSTEIWYWSWSRIPGRSWGTPGRSWRTLTTARLPSPTTGLGAATVNNVVFIFGKKCLNVL